MTFLLSRRPSAFSSRASALCEVYGDDDVVMVSQGRVVGRFDCEYPTTFGIWSDSANRSSEEASWLA